MINIEISEVNKMIDDIISIQEKWDELNGNTKDMLNDEFRADKTPYKLMAELNTTLRDCLEILEEERSNERY